jgi:hypothetical protein
MFTLERPRLVTVATMSSFAILVNLHVLSDFAIGTVLLGSPFVSVVL